MTMRMLTGKAMLAAALLLIALLSIGRMNVYAAHPSNQNFEGSNLPGLGPTFELDGLLYWVNSGFVGIINDNGGIHGNLLMFNSMYDHIARTASFETIDKSNFKIVSMYIKAEGNMVYRLNGYSDTALVASETVSLVENADLPTLSYTQTYYGGGNIHFKSDTGWEYIDKLEIVWVDAGVPMMVVTIDNLVFDEAVAVGSHAATAAAETLTPTAGTGQAITLTAIDSRGDIDTGFNGAKDVTISGVAQAPDLSYGSFGGVELTGSSQTVSVAFTNGVAEPMLKLNAAKAQTIGFSIAGLTAPATNKLTISPVGGSATQIELAQDILAPTVNGGVFARQPIIHLKDAYGNVSTIDNSTVVTVAKADAGAWTLTGTTAMTASGGVATFAGLGAENEAEVAGAQLIFSAGGLGNITSAAVTLPAPAGAQTADAGAETLTPTAGTDNAITLTVRDALGNVDAGFSGMKDVTISGVVQAPDASYGSFGGVELTGSSQTVSVAFANGVAEPTLKLNVAAAQTIGFSIAEVASPATNTLTITPTAGSTVQLMLAQDILPPAVNGGAFAQQPIIHLTDAYGNLSASDNSTVVTVAKADAGAWTLTGTPAATASGGIAIFAGLGAENTAEVAGAQLVFSADGLGDIISAAVTLPAPAGAQTADAGAETLTPTAGADNVITLTVRDALGNVDTGFSGMKSVTISGVAQAPDASYGSFGGVELTGSSQTVSVTFANGVSEPMLKLNATEAQTIEFSIAGVVSPATNTLAITPAAGSATQLVLTQDILPPAVNGGTFAQQPIVQLADAYGNVSTSDNSTVVTVAKADAGAWTLTGTLAATASSGGVTFAGLGAENAAEVAGAQLVFSAGGLGNITSAAVTLPSPAGAQTADADAETPTPTAGADNVITLTVRDALGNVDTGFSGMKDVTISGVAQAPDASFGSFGGTALTGSSQTVSVAFTNGVADPMLRLHAAVAQTIEFSIAGVASPATNTLAITPAAGSAAQLVLAQDILPPTINGATFAQQPIVQLLDAYGNFSASDNSTVVTVAKGDAGAWTLTGTLAATANGGVVTFAGLGAENAAEVAGAHLVFSAASIGDITSAVVTLPWPGLSAPVVHTVEGGNAQAIIQWDGVYGATHYLIYQGTDSGTYGPAVQVDGAETQYVAVGLTNGTEYFFIVEAANPAETSAASPEVSVTPSTVPAAPTDVTAVASNRKAVITFTAPADDGGSAITGYVVTALPGPITVNGSDSPITVEGLTNGVKYTFTVSAVNANGRSPESAPSSEVTLRAPSAPVTPQSSTETPDDQAVVTINGVATDIGTVTDQTENGRLMTTITIDGQQLGERLALEGNGSVVTLAAHGETDVFIGVVEGRSVTDMASKEAIIEIKTGHTVYTIPAQLLVAAISAEFGSDADFDNIRIEMSVGTPSDEKMTTTTRAAEDGSFALVAPPVSYEVKATYGDRTVLLADFGGYVERAIRLPQGTNSPRATTGLAIDSDGNVRHVPTRFVQTDEYDFAVINSLTNSTYAVVSRPIAFADVDRHWAKAVVNDMGSRMIVSGIDVDRFFPNQTVTRAEFAAIVIRGLGLAPAHHAASFVDIAPSDWFAGAVQTAYEYGLIEGYADGTFRPLDKVTREQAMVIISKAMKITGISPAAAGLQASAALPRFVDEQDVSRWAQDGVEATIRAGIVSGHNGSKLAPQASVTRAEAAVLIYQLLQKSGLID